MNELIQESGIPLGPIRLMGAEIVFDSDLAGRSRGRVWLPLQAANHLIYGKNGVGKSTVVELLRCALTGELPSIKARIDLFVELDENIPLPILSPKFQLEIIDDPDYDIEVLPPESSFLELDKNEEDSGINFDLTAENSQVDVDQSSNEGEYLNFDTDHLVTSISRSSFFQESCPAVGMEFEAFNEIQELIADRDQHIEIEQFVSRSWDDTSGVSLRQARTTWLSYCFLADTNSDFEYEDGMLSKIASAYREAASQKFYCLTPVGQNGAHEWELTVACRSSHESPELTDLYQVVEVSRESATMEASSQCDSPDELANWLSDSDFLWSALPSSALTDWESPTNQFLGPPPEHPFRKLRPWMERPPIVNADNISWHHLLEVLDLSKTFDYSKWRLDMAIALFPRFPDQGSWTAIFSNGPDQEEKLLESSQFNDFHALIKGVAEAVSRMDINVLDVKVQMQDDFTEWISGRALSLQAQDSTTGSWVEFTELSGAQQHIISSLLHLLKAKVTTNDGSSPLRIVLGDEPDRNMHQTAIRHFYLFVDQSETCSYLSTHSSVALSLPSFSRLHAYRLPSGNLRLMPWTPTFLANSEGIDLGVDKVAVLSAVSLVILVEGAHDEEALMLLLSLADIQISSRVLVLPWRGHRTMHTIADSYVWMNMTDARILVVVDNGRAEIINKWRAKIKESFIEGRSQAAMVRELRENSGLSGEESTLRDLLERSIQNGVTERVFAFGFSRGDIIEYTDPTVFKLTQSWDDLRLEYLRSTNRIPFKDWLRREHGAQISTRAVRTAFANLDHLDTDLINLLQLINQIS